MKGREAIRWSEGPAFATAFVNYGASRATARQFSLVQKLVKGKGLVIGDREFGLILNILFLKNGVECGLMVCRWSSGMKAPGEKA